MANAAIYHHRARVAALSRDRAPDDPELVAARRALRMARIQERIEEFTTEHPGPLTQDELETLTGLLRAGAAPKAVV